MHLASSLQIGHRCAARLCVSHCWSGLANALGAPAVLHVSNLVLQLLHVVSIPLSTQVLKVYTGFMTVTRTAVGMHVSVSEQLLG